MQNVETNKENTNPDNFLNTKPEKLNTTNSSNNNLDLEEIAELNNNEQQQIELSENVATRPKFSFASNYTPTQHFSGLSTSFDYTSHLPISSPASFAVLNNDYVSTSSYSNKPNAIVHPFRRADQAALPNTYNGSEQELTISGYNPLLSVTYPQLGASNARDFADELNRKLNHLTTIQGGQNFKNSSHHGSNQDTLNQRPLFITTVPRGIFLPPPKEIILLSPSRKRQLYAYSSHPVVYNTTSSACCNSTHNGHKPKGTIEQNYNKRNTLTVAKDKYRSNHNNGAGGGGGRAAHEIGANAIVVNDKSAATNTKTSVQSRGLNASFSPESGSLHISKEQFPQQLKQNRLKREIPPPPHEAYKNIMHERRVIRGSNFAGNQLLGEYDPFDKAAELRRRQILRKKNITHRNQRNVLGTPPPVKGRKHEDVQTDKYLEELEARPTEASAETQTDLFLEKPPTPPYIPAKIGIDVATEIKDGELFQFDAEAQPIIDLMVDSVLEISILEVAHEQEMAAIRKRQQELLAEREQELAELRRLEEEELRLQAEKERRLRQDKIAKSLDDEMQKGVTAAKLLQGHIASILPEVLNNLEPATDAAKKEHLTKTICPWLSAEVAEEVGQIVDSREILTIIIQEIIKQRAETYAGYKEQASAQFEHVGDEEAVVIEECGTENETEETTCQPDVI